MLEGDGGGWCVYVLTWVGVVVPCIIIMKAQPTKARPNQHTHAHTHPSNKQTNKQVGHALYEQGRSEAQRDLPVSRALSMGAHESQSLIWER